MKRFLNLSVVLLVFLDFSCFSSHSSNDSDIISDDKDFEAQDDDSDSQEPNSDDEEPNESTEEIFEKTEPINGYARCYDKIPAGTYEGFFADKKIESQVKQILEYDSDRELTEEDLEKVTEIRLRSKDIRGVEKLINLEYVVILTGKIYDYTPLSQLKKLKKLKIHVESMTCLDGSFSLLTNLETLEIVETKLKDVSPVEQLVNLTSLMVHDNQIEFLPENLAHLQKLEYLAFSHNNIKSVDLVKSLIKLKELYFHYNYIEDISPIKELVNLTSLGAQNNQIKDISAVTKLVNLTWLGLNQNRIERIPEDFVNLKKLKTCQLLYNNISNLPDLKGLDSIYEMWIGSNDLNNEDLMKLDALETVRFMDVALCKKITKVPIMKNLKSLKELLLTGNSINDLSGFADNESFPALKRLDVGSNKIEDVEAFRNRTGLSSLWVDKNCIKDFSPLEELKERGTYVGGTNEQLESCEDTTTLGDGE